MPKPLLAAIGLMIAAGQSALAANDQVQRAPVPDWVSPSELLTVPVAATGLMFVRRSDFLVHLDKQGQSSYIGYRAKILHANALELGNLSISWNPSVGAPTVHVIKIYRAGAVIDVLENASFEVLRREGQLEAAHLDGILTAVFRVADLRVGDEIEVAITVRTSDPTLQDTVSGILAVTPDPQPGRYKLELSWEAGQEPSVQLAPDISNLVKRTTRSIVLELDNPPSLSPPIDAPPRHRWMRSLEYSDFSDWRDVSARFSPLYRSAAALRPDSPLREEVRKIAASFSDPLARARAALSLVQQQIRYIYVGIADGNLTPATADETWQRRYGDCKGKTTLLLALLAELGIDAEAVLVNNSGVDDGIDKRLPNPGLYDHVLVRAKINDLDYWMDGTLPSVAGPSQTPILPYSWVLPLTAPGSPLQHLKWKPYDNPTEVNLLEIDARVGFDQPARITSTTIMRGARGLAQQIQLSALTTDQLLTFVRQVFVGDTWQMIDKVQWNYNLRAQASVLTISGTGIVNWTPGANGSKSLTLPGGGFSPPQRRVRPADQDQTLPYYDEPSFNCYVTTVRLPENTRPAQWSYNTGFDAHIFGHNYYRAFEKRDGTIRMVRGSRTEQSEISAQDAARDNTRIASFDNTMARINYDSIRATGSDHSGVEVPATFEIDWTADNVPCLSPASKGR